MRDGSAKRVDSQMGARGGCTERSTVQLTPFPLDRVDPCPHRASNWHFYTIEAPFAPLVSRGGSERTQLPRRRKRKSSGHRPMGKPCYGDRLIHFKNADRPGERRVHRVLAAHEWVEEKVPRRRRMPAARAPPASGRFADAECYHIGGVSSLLSSPIARGSAAGRGAACRRQGRDEQENRRTAATEWWVGRAAASGSAVSAGRRSRGATDTCRCCCLVVWEGELICCSCRHGSPAFKPPPASCWLLAPPPCSTDLRRLAAPAPPRAPRGAAHHS